MNIEVIDKYIAEYEAVISGATDQDQVDAILEKFGVNDPVYREWLILTGGGPIGPDWYDTLSELQESQDKFESEKDFWSISGFLIGWDGAGNPVALLTSGEVITEDHNFGGVHQLAPSFEALLEANVGS